ncbi:MAG: hypothetical protein CVV50_01100 [Spirochaetae bacterium HGW-Spirochaetae-6]|nr:MAG: hypothetical protein CVV50_01100 [Spirochaetae bacterium HGW-Spirochaetae-6]
MNLQSNLENLISSYKIYFLSHIAQMILFFDQLKVLLFRHIQGQRAIFQSFLERSISELSLWSKEWIGELQTKLQEHKEPYFWIILTILIVVSLLYVRKKMIEYRQAKKWRASSLSLLFPFREKKIINFSFFSKNLFDSIGLHFTLFIHNSFFLLEKTFSDYSFTHDIEQLYGNILRVGQIFFRTLDYAGHLFEKSLISLKIVKKSLRAEELLISQEEKPAIDLDQMVPDSIRQEFEQSDFNNIEQYLNIFPQQKKMVHTVASSWQSGNSTSFLIIGKKGSGKSQFMMLFQTKFFSGAKTRQVILRPHQDKKQVLQGFFHDLSNTEDFESTLAFLRESERQIIMVDGLHYLFIRQNGGYTVLEQFLDLIKKTEDKHLWIVSIDEFAYFFLKQILPLAEIFDFQLKMNILNSSEIHKIILTKLSNHGFSLAPEITPEKLSFYKKKIKKGELKYAQVPGFVLSQYFVNLVNNCENIFPAIFYYFLRSIKHKNQKQLVVDDPIWLDAGFAEKLDTIQYFIVTAIFIHEMLNAQEISTLLHLGKERTNLYLGMLFEKHLIEKTADGEDEWYYINPIMVIPLTRILKSKNFLYFI